MLYVNVLTTFLGNVLLAPFESLPPWLTLTFWSAVGGLVGMLLWGWTSNQDALKAVSARTRADLLAMKLFKDELSVTFSCQWDLLKAILLRLWLSLRPVILMMVPFVLAMAQLGARFEHRPLRVGESAIVTLTLTEDAWPKNRSVQPQVPDGVDIETPALRDKDDRTIQGRVKVLKPGRYELAWEIDGQRITKTLPAEPGLVDADAVRPGPNVLADFMDQLIYPSEPPLPAASPVARVAVALANRSTPVFGFDVHWLVTFLVLTIVFGLLLKPFLKVQL